MVQNMKHELLKVFFGDVKKGYRLEEIKAWKVNQEKKLATIVAPKAILQDNVTRINKIGKNNSKVLHK